MATYEYDMGIIGGGAAGLTAAAGAAQLGAKVLLVEKERELGGDCLHYGCVPSKTLIKCAKVYHLMKSGKRFGLPSLDPPPVDFKQIVTRIQEVVGAIERHDSEERFCSLGVKVEHGSPSFVDRHTIELDGRSYTAKYWVVATGSSPSIPPIPGLKNVSFLTNREIFYLDRLPGSMIILGAGPIAAEIAQAFCRLGTKVTVIQRSAQILSKEDKDMADELMNVLTSEGVNILLNTSAMEVREENGLTQVKVQEKGGERPRTLSAEALLVAMGRKSNIEGLGLENIGIEYDGKGLKLDQKLRTTQKHIYGAGDVTGSHQFTHAAGYEASIVVSNTIFRLRRKVNYSLVPWCTYTDPELACIGMNEKMAQSAGIPYKIYIERFKDNDRALAEGESVGKIKMLIDHSNKPLGIQILGPHAGELLGEWVAILNSNLKLSKLASTVHPYPTLGEINKRVAGTYISPKIFSNTIRKGLKFFFHLKGRACETDPAEKNSPAVILPKKPYN